MKILTDSGLSKVFSLLKTNFAAKSEVPSKVSDLTNDAGFITGVAWDDVTSKPSSFTPASHNQAANTITALTGYSKSVSGGTGALATGDTLNKALAKLENALDGKQASGNYLLATAQAADAAKLGGTAAASYAKLASPTFTGTPKAPTAEAGTNTTQIATTAFVQTAVSGLVNSAPEALDTLSELASALGDDPNFATTIATQIGGIATQVNGKVEADSADYIKAASVSSSTLTLTKGDDTTVTFTANNYTHPTTAGNKHIPAGGSSGQILGWSALGTAEWITPSSYSTFVKSGTGAAEGLVPSPSTTAGTTKFLCEDATWKVPYTHPTTAGNKHIPSGGSTGQILIYGGSSGTASWATVATGTTNGTFKIGSTEVAIAGLGSAAYTASTAYAAASHTHVSSDVTAMTGYAKASAVAAIATTDSLNTAIGKLEKALDGKQASGSYAAASHNHASNAINALTGYSKSVSGGTGALATSDTLNKALAKLENALDGKQDALTEMTTTEVETIWNNAT